MPKVDIKELGGYFHDPQSYCPHCGADECSIHGDGLLRCDFCDEIITDDNELDYQRVEKIPTKKKFKE